MAAKRGGAWFPVCVGFLAVLIVVTGCGREPAERPADEATLEAAQPGSPAQAVLVAPPADESDVPSGEALKAHSRTGKPRSHVSLTHEKDADVYHVAVQDPVAEMYDTGEGMAVRLRGGGARREPGSPDIGGMAWVLPGRVGWNLMPTVTDAAFAVATQGVDIAGIRVQKFDSGSDADEAPVTERYRSPDIYNQDAFFPTHVVRVQEAWVGTNKLVRLVVNPVQYNPVTQELRLCYRLKARLEFVKSLVPEDS